MSGRQVLSSQVLHAAIAMVVIVCATILAGIGEIDGATVVALFGAALGFAGGAALTTGAIGAAVNGKSVVSPDVMASQQATIRHAVDRLAAPAPPPAQTTPHPPRRDDP